MILLVVFTGAVGWCLRQGERPVCACFGEPSATPIAVSTLIRNLVLLAIVQVRQGMTLRAQRTGFRTSLTTGHTSLHQLLTRGRPQLLVFLQPSCGPCKSIAGSLPELSATVSEWVDVVVIGSGTIDDNAQLFRENPAIPSPALTASTRSQRDG